jgi:hypothetical protein
MPAIYYRASKFGPHWGAELRGTHRLSVTWAELVWAAVTVGKPGVAYLLAHGWHSASDIIVRSHTVYASLRQSGGRIEKSTLYESLDPTEKGATSYFVGMMAAKIIAARLLDTPWLFHLSMFRQTGGTLQLHSKSEPDLVGLNSHGNWIILEAKGRTHRSDKKAMAKGKAQTRQLRRVNGQFPTLRAVIQAHFSPDLGFSIEDPDDYDENAQDLDFDLAVAMNRYYSGVIPSDKWNREDVKLSGRKFLVETHDDIGVTVGVDTAITESWQAVTRTKQAGAASAAIITIEFNGKIFTVFPDGIVVALDDRWKENRMMRDPSLRRDD